MLPHLIFIVDHIMNLMCESHYECESKEQNSPCFENTLELFIFYHGHIFQLNLK